MPLFDYKATTISGKNIKGNMRAESKQDLRKQLAEDSLFLIEAQETKPKKLSPLKAKELADFCRELGMMLGAGVSLVRSIDVMLERDMSEKMRTICTSIQQSLRRGNMLSDALADHGAFPPLLISMIKSAEISGNMEATCKRMADHYSKSHKLKQKIKGAMIYPAILASVTAIVVLVVFLVVLPKFFQLFQDMGTDLPGITQAMLGISKWMQSNWLFLIIGILLAIAGCKGLLCLKPVRIKADMMKLNLPVVGKLFKIICTARFARTLASCYTSGVSMMNALESAMETVGNAFIEDQFDQLSEDVRSGVPLSQAIGKVKGFDKKLAASILIGEETGRLDAILENIADTLDFESEMALSKLTATVEPVLIVLMAAIIGTIIVSVILPLPSMYNAVGVAGEL